MKKKQSDIGWAASLLNRMFNIIFELLIVHESSTGVNKKDDVDSMYTMKEILDHLESHWSWFEEELERSKGSEPDRGALKKKWEDLEYFLEFAVTRCKADSPDWAKTAFRRRKPPKKFKGDELLEDIGIFGDSTRHLLQKKTGMDRNKVRRRVLLYRKLSLVEIQNHKNILFPTKWFGVIKLTTLGVAYCIREFSSLAAFLEKKQKAGYEMKYLEHRLMTHLVAYCVEDLVVFQSSYGPGGSKTRIKTYYTGPDSQEGLWPDLVGRDGDQKVYMEIEYSLTPKDTALKGKMYIDSEVAEVWIICRNREVAEQLRAEISHELENYHSEAMSRTRFRFFGLMAKRERGKTTVELARGPEMVCGISGKRKRPDVGIAADFWSSDR